MNLVEIIKSGANVNLTVTCEDLKLFGASLILETKIALEQKIEDEKSEKYLTPKQASLMLGKNLSTLWRYNRTGYLKTIEIGGSRRYRLSEINAILQKK